VSSTASNVNATPAVPSSPWPQTPAATQNNGQDNGDSPFAAMVDAAAAPDTDNAQPAPQPAAPRTSTAANQPMAKVSSGRNNSATGATQSTPPNTKAPAGAAKNATATTTPVASSNATVDPSAAQDTAANQAGTAAATDTVLAGAAATIVTDATANAATADATTKASADKHDDSGSATGAAAAPTGVQAQPVAAVIAANAAINTPPPATAAAAPDTVIGGSAKASAKPARPFVDANTASSQDGNDASAAPDANANTAPTAQDVKVSAAGLITKAAASTPDAKVTTPTTKAAAPVQGAKATTSGKQTSSIGRGVPAANANNADAASPADATEGQAWNGGSAPQVQARADGDAILPAQSGGSAATRIDALEAAAASDAGGSPAAQSGWNAAKAATEGLPNFGIIANQAATAAATPGTAAAATVPIAGLAVAIASRAQAGSSQFDIRLDPPELGRIDVRLGVDRDGQVTSHVTVDRADTLQLLQSQQPQLEHALQQAGLKTADNGLQFTLRDQSFAGQNGGSGGGAQPSAAQLVIPDAEAPIIQATQIYSRAGLGSGVDIRV
jgi:flagellar hook-length control protein FliK